MIPESAEVRKESWRRGDILRILKEKAPSREWLMHKVPQSPLEWYPWLIIGVAVWEMAISAFKHIAMRKYRVKAKPIPVNSYPMQHSRSTLIYVKGEKHAGIESE